MMQEQDPSASQPSSGVASLLSTCISEQSDTLDLSLRELALAANLFTCQAETSSSSQDFDTVYNHGLVLQELANKRTHGPGEHAVLLREVSLGICLLLILPCARSHKDAVLVCMRPRQPTAMHTSTLQACAKYEAAAALNPTSHTALYNWGVALSDLARILKESSPDEAVSCLQQASQRYAEALDCQPGNPQALNNWGLVLQVMRMRAHARVQYTRMHVQRE